MTAEPKSVRAAVARLRAIKSEHRALLEIISMDEGMSATTRSALISHVLDEEEEQVARIERGLDAEEGETVDPSVTYGRGLTVGSLRPQPSSKSGTRGTVGSLRSS